jgi:hypothetical protein
LETPQDCAQVRHDMVERRRGHGVTERLSRIARKVVAEDRTRRAGCLVPMGQVRRRAFTGWNAGFPTICLANLPRDVDIPVKLTVRFKCARLRCEQSDTEPRAAERYSSRWPLFIAGRDQNSWGPAQIQRQSDDSAEQAYDESLCCPNVAATIRMAMRPFRSGTLAGPRHASPGQVPVLHSTRKTPASVQRPPVNQWLTSTVHRSHHSFWVTGSIIQRIQ